MGSVGSVEFLGAEGNAVRYQITAQDNVDSHDLAESVSGLAALRGWALRELKPQGASLEDVFRELTMGEENQ